jgi:glucose/mannose-6-phosphate isomerase
MPGLLDESGILAGLDVSKMLDQIVAMPQQILDALKMSVEVKTKVENVCVCGMGGSAISGDILSDYSAQASTLPFAVTRGGDLPKWVGRKTLVLVASYSGGTWETLDLFDAAQKQGSCIVAITCGGELMIRCRQADISVMQVPGGVQPRAAVGHMLGACAVALEAAHVAPARRDLALAIPSVADLKQNLMPSVPTTSNAAKRIALELKGKIPVIYAPRPVRSVALRWQTQLNENAKMMSFSGEFPEMNHNQIVGWVEGEMRDGMTPVFLRTTGCDANIGERMKISIDLIREHGVEPVVVDLSGSNHLETILMGLMLGDFVSLYLAMLRGVDPSPVKSIVELKKRMK